MNIAPAHTLGVPGIDRFSPDQLLRTPRLFALNPGLPNLVDRDSGQRQWVELGSSPHLQIWLLCWPAGTHTGWHDHGGSAGAFLTVSGMLREQTRHHGHLKDSILAAGDGRSFSPNHVHHLANVGLATALSVHVYAPRLTTMTQYDLTSAGLRVKNIDRVGVNW